MKYYGYHRPHSVDEACHLLAKLGVGARIVAGGTAIGILLRERLLDADHLVSLEHLPLASVTWQDGALYVGATTSHQTLSEHPLVRERVPILAEVASLIASRRIRNVATLGGNLCWAEAASDPPGVLIALEATATVQSVRGKRTIRVGDVFSDYFTTTLAHDEILTGVRVPDPSGAGIAYVKFTPMSKADKPILGVTALVRPRGDGRCASARLILTAAGPTPIALPAADILLRGEAVDGPAAERVGQAYAEAAQPVSDTRGSETYKRRMVAVLVRRALRLAWTRMGA